MKYGPLTFQCQPFMQDELRGRGKMEKSMFIYLFSHFVAIIKRGKIQIPNGRGSKNQLAPKLG